MSDELLEAIERVAVLNTGDKLLLQFREGITRDQVDPMMRRLQELLPDVRVVFMAGGIENIAVVKGDQ